MMTLPPWQMQTPASAVIFDCDGTLSMIEGINELASYNGVGDAVRTLTENAMGHSGINPELYQARLDLVCPHYEQVLMLGKQYFTHCAPDVKKVIQILKRLKKSIYIISAGLYPAVTLFGELLAVPRKNIFAVKVTFDANGNFLDYDHHSPLVNNDGKRHIIEALKSHHPSMIQIGDGLNDYATVDLVTRFIGYGGAFYREQIAANCQYYISTTSMAPLLPLTLTHDEQKLLTETELTLYQKGLSAIHSKKVLTR